MLSLAEWKHLFLALVYVSTHAVRVIYSVCKNCVSPYNIWMVTTYTAGHFHAILTSPYFLLVGEGGGGAAAFTDGSGGYKVLGSYCVWGEGLFSKQGYVIWGVFRWGCQKFPLRSNGHWEEITGNFPRIQELAFRAIRDLRPEWWVSVMGWWVGSDWLAGKWWVWWVNYECTEWGMSVVSKWWMWWVSNECGEWVMSVVS